MVEGVIMDANKGGLIVKFGNVSGFLPVSQLTVEHYPRVEGGNKAKFWNDSNLCHPAFSGEGD